MKRFIIPYNSSLKAFAKKLRSQMTFSEVKLWNELKNRKMLGYDFDRQRPIGDYIVDFYCKDLQLAIEVDGITHDSKAALQRDKSRQESLEAQGVSFIRLDAMLVIEKVEAAVREIAAWIEAYEMEHGLPEGVKRKRESK